MVKALLKRLKARLELEKRFLDEAIDFWWKTRRYNADSHTDKDIEKMQYTLLRENHTIEKGMSMRNPRIGFGQKKVELLLGRLNDYADKYLLDDMEFLRYPLSTIKNYIDFTKRNGVNISKIELEYEKLKSRTNIHDLTIQAGVYNETKENITGEACKDFRSLLYSRHSIRYFNKEEPSASVIEQALVLAQQTPSACNRQGWKTHIFTGKKCHDLLVWQGGCKGFEEEIPYAILVTANLKAFLSYEIHQAYVDGGLYAMNLINALHFMGLGTIPLSMAFSCKKLSQLTDFNIPQSEIPIVIVACGLMEEKFRVAVSKRKEIQTTNIFH